MFTRVSLALAPSYSARAGMASLGSQFILREERKVIPMNRAVTLAVAGEAKVTRCVK